MFWGHSGSPEEKFTAIGTEASSQQPTPTYQSCEWVTVGVDPPVLVKPSDDCSLSQYFDCYFTINPKSESTKATGAANHYCCFRPLSLGWLVRQPQITHTPDDADEAGPGTTLREWLHYFNPCAQGVPGIKEALNIFELEMRNKGET